MMAAVLELALACWAGGRGSESACSLGRCISFVHTSSIG
jgi:hypothetical protein